MTEQNLEGAAFGIMNVLKNDKLPRHFTYCDFVNEFGTESADFIMRNLDRIGLVMNEKYNVRIEIIVNPHDFPETGFCTFFGAEKPSPASQRSDDDYKRLYHIADELKY